MKKKILKNVAILTFALFGLGIIGNNVMYGKDTIKEDPGDGGGVEGIICGLCTGTCWLSAPLWYYMDCRFTGSVYNECDNTATPPTNCQ